MAAVIDKRISTKAKASAMGALEFLRTDHDAVLALFDKFEKAGSDDKKQKLADEICNELKAHPFIEEEIFYPAIRAAQSMKGTDDILDEADVEHDGAKKLIEEIESSQAGAELFDAQIKVLGEYVRHHVKEEYGSIFLAARKSKLDMVEMGKELAARKRELLNEK